MHHRLLLLLILTATGVTLADTYERVEFSTKDATVISGQIDDGQKKTSFRTKSSWILVPKNARVEARTVTPGGREEPIPAETIIRREVTVIKRSDVETISAPTPPPPPPRDAGEDYSDAAENWEKQEEIAEIAARQEPHTEIVWHPLPRLSGGVGSESTNGEDGITSIEQSVNALPLSLRLERPYAVEHQWDFGFGYDTNTYSLKTEEVGDAGTISETESTFALKTVRLDVRCRYDRATNWGLPSTLSLWTGLSYIAGDALILSDVGDGSGAGELKTEDYASFGLHHRLLFRWQEKIQAGFDLEVEPKALTSGLNSSSWATTSQSQHQEIHDR